MKQRKPTPLIVPILWFLTTGLWTITFCRNLAHGGDSGLLLQAATVLVSLAAALVNLHRYRRDHR